MTDQLKDGNENGVYCMWGRCLVYADETRVLLPERRSFLEGGRRQIYAVYCGSLLGLSPPSHSAQGLSLQPCYPGSELAVPSSRVSLAITQRKPDCNPLTAFRFAIDFRWSSFHAWKLEAVAKDHRADAAVRSQLGKLRPS